MKSLVAAMLMTGMLASFAPSPASADSITFGYHTVRGDWDGDRGRRHDRDDRRWSGTRHEDRRWGHAHRHVLRYPPVYPTRAYAYPIYPQVIVRPAPQHYYYTTRY